MKKSITRISTIILLITGMTVGLIGCGSGADDESMRQSSSLNGASLK